jgi:HlyD family secretion protein
MTSSTLLRRVLPAAIVLLLLAGAVFWGTRAKPVAVLLKGVDRGNVESTVVNTRAGSVEACLRTRLSRRANCC